MQNMIENIHLTLHLSGILVNLEIRGPTRDFLKHFKVRQLEQDTR
jgi:hypothetical protein